MKIKLRKSVAVVAWSVTPRMKNLMLNLKMLIKKDHEKYEETEQEWKRKEGEKRKKLG